MKAETYDCARAIDTMVVNVRDLLESPNPHDRVRAIHHLATGIEQLEHRVVFDAQASGMTWADIGDVYGVSRQAVHRRFSNETVVSSEFFDELLRDGEPEVVPSLARAAMRARDTVAPR